MFKWLTKRIHKAEFKQLVDYIEGRINNEDFINLYLSTKTYRKIINVFTRHRDFKYPLDDEFDKRLIKKDYADIIYLQHYVNYCLDYFKIEHKINIIELKMQKKWYDYIPYFVNHNHNIYCELEKKDPERKHSKKWYRNYFLKRYKYTKYPPRWLQFAEWPMDDDDEPCLFLYQTGFPNKHDYIEYHFRKKDGKEIIVEQYD